MKKTMLIKVDSNANNNKFYEVILFDDGRVQKRWGRVGQEGTISTEMTGERGYNSAINGKKRRGYTETAIVDSEVSAESKQKFDLADMARKALLKDPNVSDPSILDLIDRLVAQNKHQIIANSGGMIKVDDDGVLKTALGIIDKGSIAKARGILEAIKTGGEDESQKYRDMLEEYLTLVPQKVPARGGWHKGFFEGDKFDKQMEFLEQLEKSYEWYEQSLEAAKQEAKKEAGKKKDEAPPPDLFRYKVDLLTDEAKFKELEKFFRSTANNMHGNHVNRAKVSRIYVLDDSASAAGVEAVGNVRTLWHGSRVYNVLSILSKGLLNPRSLATAMTAGAMFGHGLYFSNTSTKSAQYSSGGVWSSGRDNKWYMFVVDVACGNEYQVPKHHEGYGFYDQILEGKKKDKNGNRYDSINVKPNHGGVYNHELIVPTPDQVRLRYLIEFDS